LDDVLNEHKMQLPKLTQNFFVFLNGKAGDVGFYFISRSQYSYRHKRAGINVHFFLLLHSNTSCTVAVNTFTFLWPQFELKAE